jgi:hypothetical protein
LGKASWVLQWVAPDEQGRVEEAGEACRGVINLLFCCCMIMLYFLIMMQCVASWQLQWVTPDEQGRVEEAGKARRTHLSTVWDGHSKKQRCDWCQRAFCGDSVLHAR